MGIGIDKLAVRERIPLPRLAGSDYSNWLQEYAGIVTNGTRAGRIQPYILLDEMVIETKEVIVHKFTMGDVDDPDLYAAEPLYQWQTSEAGKWVMENCMATPVWYRHADPMQWGHSYIIKATFSTKKLTEFYLRFGKNSP